MKVLLVTFFLITSDLGLHASADEECPPIPESAFPNGQMVRINHRSFYVKCDEDYKLIGRRNFKCYEGTWYPSLDKSFCNRIDNRCSSPPLVPNANITHSKPYNIGSRVFYACHEGYFLFGKGSLTCSPDIIWDHDPPRCLPRMTKASDIANKVIGQAQMNTAPADRNNSTTSDMAAKFIDISNHPIGLDLVLLLDRSSSVDAVDLESGKRFFKILLESFGVDNTLKTNKTRLSVITFGDKAEVVCSFADKTVNSTKAATEKINTIEPYGGGTAMEPALSRIFEPEFSTREGAKNALFLLTDGEPTIGDQPPEEIAHVLKKALNYEIFMIGVGDINKTRLSLMASDPVPEHVFFLNSFEDINEILDKVKNPPPVTTPRPPPGPDVCGISDIKRSKSRPWLTAIIVQHTLTPEGTTFCAGVQICSKWVLTSANCFRNGTYGTDPSKVGLVIGAHDLSADGHNAYAKKIHFSIEEDHNGTAIKSRLALIELDHPVPNHASRPVCLSKDDSFTRERLIYNLNTEAFLEGWATRAWNSSLKSISLSSFGNRDISLFHQAPLLEEHLCLEAIRKRDNQTSSSSKNLLCIGNGNRDKGNDTCVGSLGSPLVTKSKSGQYELLGVQTDLLGCFDSPTIFVDPIRYRNWMQNVTKECHEQHEY